MLAVRFLDETRSGGDLSCADYRAGLVEIRQWMAARTAMRNIRAAPMPAMSA
jgi:hypothetical protein